MRTIVHLICRYKGKAVIKEVMKEMSYLSFIDSFKKQKIDCPLKDNYFFFSVLSKSFF
jgi:hypothetical protein